MAGEVPALPDQPSRPSWPLLPLLLRLLQVRRPLRRRLPLRAHLLQCQMAAQQIVALLHWPLQALLPLLVPLRVRLVAR